MMLALSLLSVLVALNVSNLLDLIKITFSISAGVAPLFILRWIWFRINAWSQLTAMLSSGVFTLAYPYLHENSPLRQLPLEESRILVVTILTTVTWIIVTLISSNQTKTVEENLLPIIGSRKQMIYRLSMAILLGITLTYCTYIIWKIILG
jgi:Na+/proline symporter